MNKFDNSTRFMLDRNGHPIVYYEVTEGSYNVETGKVVNTEVSKNLKAYPKIVKANQYNYPNLIGKEVVEFLVSATDLSKTPDVNDKIVYDSKTYMVESYMTHNALGQVILYRITTTKL